MTVRSASVAVTILCVTVLLFSGCVQPLGSGGSSGDDGAGGSFPGGSFPGGGGSAGAAPVAIVITGESFTFAWDAVAGDVSSYQVFYRPHGSGSWVRLDEIPAEGTPMYSITNSTLDYGSYDFAVRAAMVDGELTDYHCSLDSTAQPNEGWYVEWSEG